MNLRHATVLALVGLYLTIQAQPEQCLSCENTSPVGVCGVYPNASDCERVRKKLTAIFVENQKHPKTKWQEISGSGCDSSDDQMFKRKGRPQLKFLSPLEKNGIITAGVPD